jgi:hypothetical protein
MKFMMRGSPSGMPPLVGVRPTTRMGAASYKSAQPSANGFRLSAFCRFRNVERYRQQTQRGRP